MCCNVIDNKVHSAFGHTFESTHWIKTFISLIESICAFLQQSIRAVQSRASFIISLGNIWWGNPIKNQRTKYMVIEKKVKRVNIEFVTLKYISDTRDTLQYWKWNKMILSVNVFKVYIIFLYPFRYSNMSQNESWLCYI